MNNIANVYLLKDERLLVVKLDDSSYFSNSKDYDKFKLPTKLMFLVRVFL